MKIKDFTKKSKTEKWFITSIAGHAEKNTEYDIEIYVNGERVDINEWVRLAATLIDETIERRGRELATYRIQNMMDYIEDAVENVLEAYRGDL